MISPSLYALVLMAFVLASNAFQNVIIPQKVTNTPSLHMATWSNGQAIQEYKDFLATGMFLRLFLCFVLVATCDMNIYEQYDMYT